MFFRQFLFVKSKKSDRVEKKDHSMFEVPKNPMVKHIHLSRFFFEGVFEKAHLTKF